MGIGALSSPAIETILGVDASSKSMAFAIINSKGVLILSDEVVFTETDTTERLVQARHKVTEAFANLPVNVDCVILEKPIFVNSNLTASILSQFAGVIKSIIAEDTKHYFEIAPTEWYKVIGNSGVDKEGKQKIIAANPDKKPAWLKAEYRRLRKQYTIDWVKERHGIEVANDNIADAIGCCEWGLQRIDTLHK